MTTIQELLELPKPHEPGAPSWPGLHRVGLWLPTSFLSATGMDTHELIQRVRHSAVDNGTLDAIAVKVEQLCCDYVSGDAVALIAESREWLTRITELLDRRLSFTQHRDILDAAGTLALLVGYLEYDTGQKAAAEATRKAARSLGTEAATPTSSAEHTKCAPGSP
jgi:hypothetical protein